MVNIIIPFYTSRLDYTIKVIFQYIYKIPYQVTKGEDRGNYTDKEKFMAVLNYTNFELEDSVFIPDIGFLTYSPEIPPVINDNWHKSEKINSFESRNFSFDIFSAIFFLISDYEKYFVLSKDEWGRYHYNVSEEKRILKTLPLVHLYCEKLLIFFPETLKKEILKNRKYRVSLTWDIDNPWKDRHKSYYKMVGGTLRDLMTFNRERLRERWKAYVKKKDVNDLYEEIFRLSPPEITTFFFLIDGNSPRDSSFSYKTPALRKLILEIHRKGYEIGIHPSFDTFNNKDKIRSEIAALANILQTPIIASRQHFLRFQLPETFRYLYENGIRNEYSYCFTDTIGFPNGMMMDYPWFDLMSGKETDLMICPSVLMDRAFVSHRKESDEVIFEEFCNALTDVKRLGGVFRIIFHNEALSESGDWKGKSNLFRKMIKKLQILEKME